MVDKNDLLNSRVIDEKFNTCEKYYDNDQMAIDTLKKKYLAPGENNLIDMWARLAIAAAEPEEDKEKWANNFFDILIDFKFLPGGRINFGLGRNDVKATLSNCYVVPIQEDSLIGIYKALMEQALTYKLGGGCGHDLSILRPKGKEIKGTGGDSCGPVGFMDLLSISTKTVRQRARRGANMQSILVSHPDIVDFINVKDDTRKHVEFLQLIASKLPKYKKEYEELYDYIESRRAISDSNISVKLTDSFLSAVEKDEDFDLTWGDEVYETVKAKDIWNLIIEKAWSSGEPGLMFWDRMVENNNLEYYNPIISTNPCISGDTLIAVADGRNAVSIKQLAEEGKDVPVYSTNLETGKVEIKWGRHPRKTGVDKDVMKLTLDDGSTFIATPGHKILCKDLQYKELQKLEVGDSIFPFNSFENNRYRQICNVGKKMLGGKFRNRRQYRIIHEFFTGEVVDPKVNALHHRNYNSKDDSIDNLVVMSHEEHKELHASRMRGKNNPYFKMSDEWRKEFRKKATRYGAENGKYINVSNEKLIEYGRALYKKYNKFSRKIWSDFAKENGLPQFISNKCRFDSWDNFRSIVINNHKVVSIEKCEKQDVYNISVDDNENYHIITSTKDEHYVTSSGICVKNCSEISLGKYGNCLLGHMTLSRYCIKDGHKFKFDYASFENDIKVAMRFLDNIITINDGKHALPEQNEVAKNERRTGLGITGLGDALIMLGLRYGSDEAIQFLEHVMSTFRNCAYSASCDLAEERGAFPVFNAEGFFKSLFAQRLPSDIKKRIKEKGIRNGMLLTCAPVGTGSIIAQVSSGIEPIFRKSYTRRIRDEVDTYKEYKVYHPLIQNLFGDNGSFPEYVVDSTDISSKDRIKIQATIQKYIDNSISSTVNLSNKATKEDVAAVYMYAWKMGCKGVTVYREGSRRGVLVSDEFSIFEKDSEDENLLKRPTKLEGETFKRKVDLNGTPRNCYITVNFFPDSKKPYELLISEPHVDKEMKDIIMLEMATRCTSLMLRHGVPIRFIIEQFEKIDNQYLYSIPISISSVLRNYTAENLSAENEDEYTGFEMCPCCSGQSLKLENGCYLCVNCGYSKCN